MEQNVNKRETFRNIELNGRKWRVEKFDALTGSYLAYQLINLALPPMIGKLLANSGIPVGGDHSGRVMSKQEFMEFQKDCLRVCFEILPARNAPVIAENDNWGVEELEKDLSTVLMLTVHVLIFNVQSFFEEGPWKGLGAELTDSSQPDAQT